MEPLAKEPAQVLVRYLFRHAAERILIHVLEAPPCVVGAQDLTHRVVAHDVPQLLVEQLPLLVDHRVIRGEIPIALTDHRDRLAPAVQIPEQDVAFQTGIFRAAAVRLEKPARLEAREAFVEIALAPLVIGEDSHGIVVAELVDDEAETGAAVHDHHGKFGATALDAMNIGDLGPRECAVQRVEPAERDLGASDGDAFAPGGTVARLIEHVHDDVFVPPLLVAVIRVQREGEMVN